MSGTRQHLAPKKSFGQHFLNDASVIQKILAAVPWDSAKKIVEVGPGRGALTIPMYAKLSKEGRASDVILVELDADLLPNLRERFPEAEIVHADAAQVDWAKITSEESWLLVSNLPYNAGTAIVNEAFWGTHPPVAAVVMLQKEVGERILAKPPDMSVLSVAMQLKTQAKRVCNVKPGAFIPPPKVDSIVLSLVAVSTYEKKQAEQMVALAKKGFAHARKQLRQTLAQGGEGEREEIGKVLAGAGLSPLARPEELSLAVWAALVKDKR
ncbi:MAG: 16S rRNA (adenine(1518)-N(6)/adenine(1519)-N(6))-dimethyltransferase RsmA [Patescibacteria group bacterium]